jgi:hypothetical protein
MSEEDTARVVCMCVFRSALAFFLAVLCFRVAFDDPRSTARFKAWTDSLLAWWNATMDRVANFIQDCLIEWDLENETRRFGETPPPLPPLDANAFAEAMLPEINQLLDAVTQRINEAPSAPSISGHGPEVRKLVEAWTKRALEVGEQLRIDAAADELPALNTPHSDWARKFRRMKAAEGELAPTADE